MILRGPMFLVQGLYRTAASSDLIFYRACSSSCPNLFHVCLQGAPVYAVDGGVVLETYAAAECETTERLVLQKTAENSPTPKYVYIKRGGGGYFVYFFLCRRENGWGLGS